jgi:predicted phage terminase large subunit-like protein
MAKESMAKVIGKYSQVAEKMHKDCDMSESMVELVSDMAKMLKFEIHEYLNLLSTPEAEAKIRDYVKFSHSVLLPLIEAKILHNKKRIDKIGNMKYGLAQIPDDMQEEMKRCMEIRDDIYALIAFRSLKHLALFMEEDKPLDEQDWHNAGTLFDGLWFHANRMILDGTVQFLMKQMPTGFGKSYSDIVMISFILGVNIDDDVIKMFGNKTNITPCMNSLVDYMTSRRYAKVFPYYEQFSCSEELMFETMKKSAGQLKIKGSKKPINVLVASKETAITGARAKFLFIDDITQREDAGNMREHEKDITRFNDIWKKRNYYLDKFRIIASGTSYSVNDILSYLRGVFGAGREGNKITHKYVEVAECDELKEGGESVFVKIPKLDYDTDEATYPVKSPTKQARLDRDKDPVTFAAMDQQNPLPPEGTPFAYNKLDTYDVIPHEDSDTCWACIDPARTGKNYVTMLIFKKVPIGNLYKHYLIDCVYELRPMDDMYPFFIEKIINHRITKLHIERNTDTSLKRTILMMLQAKGVSFCEISEVYSTKKKEDKIYDMEAAILNNVKFPVQGMYSPNSQMGTAMRHITSYSYKVKVDYDDAPDCLAMYCEKYVMETRSLPKVQILDIRRRKY